MAQESRTAADGVYTAAQAQRGKALYFETCVQCHGGELQGVEDRPSLNGQPFFEHFGGQSVEMLFNLVNRSMPQGAPGILGATGNADVVAFLLSQNNFPAGQSELPADPKVLGAIIINHPDAGRSAAAPAASGARP